MGKKKRPPIPHFGRSLHETHCHLDYMEPDDLEYALKMAAEVGIDRILTISVSPDNLTKVQELAVAYDQVYCTQGIHPHEAKDFNKNVESRIRQALKEQQSLSVARKIRAVGEIGLDYFYDHSDPSVQRQVFEKQLAIAIDFKLPVVIHARDADQDCMDILKAMAGDLTTKGVIHSFTAGRALAEVGLDLGFSLGFNGIITFNKSDNVREVLAATPIERILLETDSPYLTPVPYRGVTNEPKYLPFVAQKVAEIKQVETSELIDVCNANAEFIFWDDL